MLAACLAAGHDAMVSHRTAASLWGLPVEWHGVELAIPARRRISLPGVVVHRAVERSEGSQSNVRGVPVTNLARTIFDLAGVLREDELRTVFDHVLAERLLSAAALRRALARFGGHGRKGARRVSALLDELATGPRQPESRLELRLLKTLREHGVSLPVPQFPVRLPNGTLARLDFAYPDVRLALEADSYRHHSTVAAWSRDRVRNNELIALGWRILPVTYRDLVTDPSAIADQVARCLRQSGGNDVWKKRRGNRAQSSKHRGKERRADV